MKNIKGYTEFVNELNISAYDDNRIGIKDFVSDRFIAKFLTEFPYNNTRILTSDGEYTFIHLDLLDTTNLNGNYELVFESTIEGNNTKIHISHEDNGACFYVESNNKEIEILGKESNLLIKKMFKYIIGY